MGYFKQYTDWVKNSVSITPVIQSVDFNVTDQKSTMKTLSVKGRRVILRSILLIKIKKTCVSVVLVLYLIVIVKHT